MFNFLGKLFYEKNFGLLFTKISMSSLIPQKKDITIPNSAPQMWVQLHVIFCQ